MGALALGDTPKERRVTMDLREAKIGDALRMVLRNSPDSLVVAPGALQQGQKVSLSLKAVPVSTAVRLICSAAGVVGTRSKEGVWQITAPQAMIQVNNQSVPILGALQVGSNNQMGPVNLPPEVLRQLSNEAAVLPISPPAAERGGPLPEIPAPVMGSDLASLQVDNASLPDAITRLRVTSGQDVVTQGVPEKLRVTAHVYLMPFTQFLQELASQAGLAVQWQVVSNADGKPVPGSWWSGGYRPMRSGVPGISISEQHWRYYLVPLPSLALRKGEKALQSQVYPDFPRGEQDQADLVVTDAPLVEAMAKLSSTSGYDIVVNEAVPPTLRLTARAYRVPVGWLLDTLTSAAGLELREQVLDKEGKPVPSLRPSPGPARLLGEGYHTRYYLVPKSELKVTGSAGRVFPRAMTLTPEAWEFRSDHGPVHLDPSHFIVGLLSSDPNSRQVAALVR
jgi:hypothetical protein